MGATEWIALAIGTAGIMGSIISAAWVIGSRISTLTVEVHSLKHEFSVAMASNEKTHDKLEQENQRLWQAHEKLRERLDG